MLAPGEQPRVRPVNWRTVAGALIVCAPVAALLASHSSDLDEYRLYFIEDRKPASLALSSLSEDWTETSVRDRFDASRINCNAYQGPLPVQRVCTVDVKSVNGVPALYITFMFAGGHLDQMIINIPWWPHGKAHDSLVDSLGSPKASQLLPHDGLRLIGWQLDNGSAVFLNRDLPHWFPFWSGIYWRSASACRTQGCFNP